MIGGVVVQVAIVFAVIAIIQESGTNWLAFIGFVVLALASLWTTIAVTARRFRDLGQSPWMTLLLLVPLIGELWVFVVCGFFPNSKQRNRKLVIRQVDHSKQQAEQVVAGNPLVAQESEKSNENFNH